MATALIQNGAAIGAAAGLLANRSQASKTATDYAHIKDEANAIATEVAAACVTAGVADADKAAPAMEMLAAAVTQAIVVNRSQSSTTATDYLSIATTIAVIMKELEANLT